MEDGRRKEGKEIKVSKLHTTITQKLDIYFLKCLEKVKSMLIVLLLDRI